jgi:hypothetical protein
MEYMTKVWLALGSVTAAVVGAGVYEHYKNQGTALAFNEGTVPAKAKTAPITVASAVGLVANKPGTEQSTTGGATGQPNPPISGGSGGSGQPPPPSGGSGGGGFQPVHPAAPPTTTTTGTQVYLTNGTVLEPSVGTKGSTVSIYLPAGSVNAAVTLITVDGLTALSNPTTAPGGGMPVATFQTGRDWGTILAYWQNEQGLSQLATINYGTPPSHGAVGQSTVTMGIPGGSITVTGCGAPGSGVTITPPSGYTLNSPYTIDGVQVDFDASTDTMVVASTTNWSGAIQIGASGPTSTGKQGQTTYAPASNVTIYYGG